MNIYTVLCPCTRIHQNALVPEIPISIGLMIRSSLEVILDMSEMKSTASLLSILIANTSERPSVVLVV